MEIDVCRGEKERAHDSVVVLLAECLQLVLGVDVVRRDVGDELRCDLLLHVDASTGFARRRRAYDALLVRHIPAHEVAGLIVAALDGNVLLVERGAVENQILVVVALDRESRDVEGIEVEILLRAKLTGPPSRHRRDVGTPDRATLGEDLDDAVVGPGAVEGGSGSSPDDLDVLDVVWIEIGEPVLRIRATTKIGELARLVVDDDAVDDVEGIGARDEGVGAAKPYRDSTPTRATRVLGDLRAGNFALHRLIHGLGLRSAEQR